VDYFPVMSSVCHSIRDKLPGPNSGAGSLHPCYHYAINEPAYFQFRGHFSNVGHRNQHEKGKLVCRSAAGVPPRAEQAKGAAYARAATCRRMPSFVCRQSFAYVPEVRHSSKPMLLPSREAMDQAGCRSESHFSDILISG